MTNDPRDVDGKRLKAALYKLGRNVKLRKELITLLKYAEVTIEYDGSMRDDVTGPIVDALHGDDDIYEKTLADGTKFKFLFRTQIARDFLMSEQDNPTHVWEPQTTKLLMHLITESHGDVIVGGAYFGDHAILIATRIKATVRVVHCFEPNKDQATMLSDNKQINGLKNMVVNTKGLWSKSSVHLKLDGFDSFANAIEADESESGFETVSIDDYCSIKKSNIGLIQLDIEGAELEALSGALNTISSDKPFIVFEVHRDYVDWTHGLDKTPVCKLLLDHDYTIFAIRDFHTHREMVGLPVELIPIDKVYLEGPPHGFNMVAVPDPSIFKHEAFKMVECVSPKLLLHKSAKLHHPTDGS